MKPTLKRLLGPLILTACYWFVAFAFVGLSVIGDCFAAAAQCEASRRSTALVIMAAAIAIYAFLLLSLARKRNQNYWLVVTTCLLFVILGYLMFGLGIY